MLKLKNITGLLKNITSSVKLLFLGLFISLAFSFSTLKHPYYISMIDLKYNQNQKSIQISARLFTNDLEEALRKINNKAIDVINPKNKAEVDSILLNYIKTHLTINVNSKNQLLHYIGSEKEEESIWVYCEIKKITSPKTLTINTKLLYDFLPQEVNIVHADINGIKKSNKVTNPDSKIVFSF